MADSLTSIAVDQVGCLSSRRSVPLPLTAQVGNQQSSVPRPSGRLSVNGVLLRYLDGGGSGETILFLTGLEVPFRDWQTACFELQVVQVGLLPGRRDLIGLGEVHGLLTALGRRWTRCDVGADYPCRARRIVIDAAMAR